MDSAFCLLLALPSSGALILTLFDWLRGVPIADALVTAIQQLVVGKVVYLHVVLYLLKCPICEWIDLDKTGFINFNNVQISSLAPLTSSSARQDGVDLQLSICSLCRLNLGDPVVELIVRFPEFFAILLDEFLGGLDSIGLIHMDVDKRVLFADPVDQRKGLGEVMQSIEKDEIDNLWSGYLEF